MPARRPRDAVRQWTDRLTRITTCVTDRPLLATGHAVGRDHFVSFLPKESAAPLRVDGVRGRLGLGLRLDYRVETAALDPSMFECRTMGYSYRVLERGGRELIVYHLHPAGASTIRHPHLHLSSRLPGLTLDDGGSTIALSDLHIPTAAVTLADVVRFLIAEVSVEPRRADWEKILAEGGN